MEKPDILVVVDAPPTPKRKKTFEIGALVLPSIKCDDYQDEFMANYGDFSASWRKQIDEQRRF